MELINMDTYGVFVMYLIVFYPTAKAMHNRPVKKIVFRSYNVTLSDAKNFAVDFIKANQSINPDMLECSWQIQAETWNGSQSHQ